MKDPKPSKEGPQEFEHFVTTNVVDKNNISRWPTNANAARIEAIKWNLDIQIYEAHIDEHSEAIEKLTDEMADEDNHTLRLLIASKIHVHNKEIKILKQKIKYASSQSIHELSNVPPKLKEDDND